jgi:hypothetical protein
MIATRLQPCSLGARHAVPALSTQKPSHFFRVKSATSTGMLAQGSSIYITAIACERFGVSILRRKHSIDRIENETQ